MANEKVNIPTIKLNNGLDMPMLGFGTWLGFNDQMQLDMPTCDKMVDALDYAIDIGYRHIDTAHLYRVEPEIGDVIEKKIKEGVVKREELFVTTKVWQHYHREKDVEVSLRKSLQRMKLDYVDQLLIHWPMSHNEEGVDEKIDYLETWRGFEAVLRAGLTKSIGVSNFTIAQLKRLIAFSKVVPAAHQIEVNLNLAQNELVDYCKSQGIVVVAYAPFGCMVPSKDYPDSPEPKINNPQMVALAKKYNKTVTQIVLRHFYERGLVSVPKTVTRSRVLENASIFDFKLDAQDMKVLESFNNGYRSNPVLWYMNFDHYPFEKVKVDKIPEIPSGLLKWKNGKNQNIP